MTPLVPKGVNKRRDWKKRCMWETSTTTAGTALMHLILSYM
jgi:hypothetical protein